jgi:hypothetical protein
MGGMSLFLRTILRFCRITRNIQFSTLRTIIALLVIGFSANAAFAASSGSKSPADFVNLSASYTCGKSSVTYDVAPVTAGTFKITIYVYSYTNTFGAYPDGSIEPTATDLFGNNTESLGIPSALMKNNETSSTSYTSFNFSTSATNKQIWMVYSGSYGKYCPFKFRLQPLSTSTPVTSPSKTTPTLSITITDSANKIVNPNSIVDVDTPLKITALASSTTPNGTGSIVFFESNIELNVATSTIGQPISFSFTASKLGARKIVAFFAPANFSLYHVSPSVEYNFFVKAPTTLTLKPFPSTTVSGAPVILEAVLANGAPGSFVTFKDGDIILGTVATDANGIARLTFTPSVGPHNISVGFPGDTTHQPSSIAPVYIQTIKPTIQPALDLLLSD